MQKKIYEIPFFVRFFSPRQNINSSNRSTSLRKHRAIQTTDCPILSRPAKMTTRFRRAQIPRATPAICIQIKLALVRAPHPLLCSRFFTIIARASVATAIRAPHNSAETSSVVARACRDKCDAFLGRNSHSLLFEKSFLATH